jgi:nitrate reductase assembly molybdenum cofactor insertion protein NarJ
MTIHATVRRAQLYSFLAEAFLYPTENWSEELTDLYPILADLGLENLPSPASSPALPQAPVLPACLACGCAGEGATQARRQEAATFPRLPSNLANAKLDRDDRQGRNLQLTDLQEAHRRTFGLTGSLCYETELGLPNEFRQSQELADIAGFYRAFGFQVGGEQRERPDHLATELEFLYVLSLKEAYAAEQGIDEHVEVCVEARRHFLRDHLGRWIGLFVQSVSRGVGSEGEANPYLWLTRLAAAFVHSDAHSLGLSLEDRRLEEVRPTPQVPDISCETCPANTLSEE